MSPRKSTARLSIGKKILFASVICISFVALAEFSFRVLGLGKQQEVADYIANWKLQWDQDYYVADPLSHPGVINKDGLRDRDHPVKNIDNKTRVVCLGDSVTFGYQLSLSKSYPSILEEQLKQENVEVFNIALPGWSTRQERLAYERIVVRKRYKPEYVILGVSLNDIPEISNNMMEPPSPVLVSLYENSNFVRWIMRPHAWEIYRVEELFENSKEPRIQTGWQLFFDEVKTLNDNVKADGAQLAVLSTPFRFQVLDNAPPAIPQGEIKRFCDENSIRFFDAMPVLQPLGPKGFLDEGHLSHQGCAKVAGMLVESGWLTSAEIK